jgi:pimeloyl-ACP methyl ester carboxylesterase
LFRRDRDLVFVDQRGTGESNPLACNLYPDKNDMAAYFNEVLSLDRLRACRLELEKVADLKLYSTSTAMDDFDEVRAALGYEKINLFGGSYGSTAALAYLRQYPVRVRTATILGVAPPDMKLPLPVIKGVQNAVDRVFADCAADEKCRAAFPNPKGDLDAAIKRLEKEPARFETVNPFTGKSHQVTLTRPVFGEFVRTMLYQQEFSRWLPLLLNKAAAGEFELFATVAFQSFRGIEDQIARGMHFSVVCAEDVPFITDADVALENTGSFYGDYRLQAYRKICEFWPRANVPAAFARPVVSDAPVLLISGEADPVAPPWLAAAAAARLPNGRHITVPHTGHSFSFPCVDNLVAEFVSKGSAKELDVSCVAQIRRPPFITEEMLRAIAKSQMASDDKAAAANELVWQGTLDVGVAKLRLALRLSKGANGEWTGKLDSPDQGTNNLPIDTITWKDQTFRFEMGMIGAVYEGRVTADGAEIAGEWRQQSRAWPLNFKRTSAAK